MSTMAEISNAITQIDIKKQTLLQSFEHLQSQTPSSFTLPFTWADFDSYFTTLQSSLQSKFNLLQSFSPSSHTSIGPSLHKLKSFCQNSDGLGLHGFITVTGDRNLILAELPDAYRCSPDAPAMVLGVIGGFFRLDCTGTQLRLFRDGCLIMLEGLVCVDRVVSIEAREKALEMAVEWNRKRGDCSVGELDQIVLGFLLLVDAFRLVDRFDVDEVVDCLVSVAGCRESVDLCRRIVPGDKINDVIQRLVDKDMHVIAVKFSIQLQKTDEFSPVGLLEKRKLMSVSIIEETLKNAEDLKVHNNVTRKEINVLKSIIECIDENHLQSEYPKDNLVELVKKLKSEVDNSRRAIRRSLRSRKQPPRKRKNMHWGPKRSKTPNVVELVNRLENEVENNEQSLLNDLRSRNQLAKLKSKLNWSTKMKRSTKPKLNKIIPSIQESNSQKSDLLPDHVGDDTHSPKGSGATVSKDTYANPNGSGGSGPSGSKDFYADRVLTPTDSKDPYANQVSGHHSIGSDPITSKDLYADRVSTPTDSKDLYANQVSGLHSIGSDPTGCKDLYADRVSGHHSIGSDPTGSKDLYADRASTSIDSKDLYANQVSGHPGLATVKIDYSFYVPQLQPTADNNSNGWISD